MNGTVFYRYNGYNWCLATLYHSNTNHIRENPVNSRHLFAFASRSLSAVFFANQAAHVSGAALGDASLHWDTVPPRWDESFLVFARLSLSVKRLLCCQLTLFLAHHVSNTVAAILEHPGCRVRRELIPIRKKERDLSQRLLTHQFRF
jgi:hypothetical protein